MENKIEELEQKCVELSRSKKKAKLAYFKLKKESENDKEEKDKLNSEITKLQGELISLNDMLKKQSEDSLQKDAKIAELTKQIDEKKNESTTLEVEVTSSSNYKEEIEDLKQEIADLENVVNLKIKQEVIYTDIIKDLKEELKISTAEQCGTERENKKRKLDDGNVNANFAKDHTNRILELRVADLIKKRDLASRAYSEMEAKYDKLKSEMDSINTNTSGATEDESLKMANVLTEKDILLEKLQSSLNPLDSLAKALKSDLDDIKKIASPAGLTTIVSTLEEVKSRLKSHFKLEDTPTIAYTTGEQLHDTSDLVDIGKSADNLHTPQNGDVAKLLEMIDEILKLCNLELEQQVVIRTRAKYLDAKFANFEYDMASLIKSL